MSDILQQASKDYESSLNDLDKRFHGQCKLTDIEIIAEEMLATIPKLNRDKLRDEMSQMHVAVYPNPSTFNINEGLALAQGYRERLAGILALADQEFNTRSKVLEMLMMAHIVTSKASSADKRKGEALIKYPSQFLALEAAETFKNEVMLFLKNMQSTSETISRQASVLQAQIALGEVRRKDYSDNVSSMAEETIRKGVVNKPIEELEW